MLAVVWVGRCRGEFVSRIPRKPCLPIATKVAHVMVRVKQLLTRVDLFDD